MSVHPPFFRSRGRTVAMYTLYYYPDNANLVPHMILREIGVPFTLALVDRAQEANREPDYLALNPGGLLPTLVDGDLVLTETAAICLHLADRHPDGGLAPSVGTPERARLYRWLFFLASELHAELRMEFYTWRHTTEPAAVPSIKAATKTRLDDCLALIDHDLSAAGAGPYVLGSTPSVADYYLATCCRWARQYALRPPRRQRAIRPPREFARIAMLLDALQERAAVKAAFKAEGLDPPYF